ncbi:hypothetical protein FAB82_08030 [Glycomyces buryatensis]|uniref:Bacterial bifunctional deaminase-reductase C-terminal domain-containing protein n=1 Tax=Glycomyces buryatensis TaxID=2570927 RepID=A0A4S8QGV7_9ACTN|nr:hypothetical protein FAB82_08030 [Glycomyces buryatensis]
MGELIVTEYMTLDGVAQAISAPEEDPSDGFEYGGWQVPLVDPEAEDVMFGQAKSMDALLLGRRTYDLFAGYWPTAPDEIDFKPLLNRVPKYVASRTLKEPLAWEGASVLAGDLAEGVAGLKGRYRQIHVIGSLNLVQSLLAQGLVDRMNVWIHPVVLGRGKRVFEGGAMPSALRLTKSRIFPSGSLQLEYEWAGEPTLGDLTTGHRLGGDGPPLLGRLVLDAAPEVRQVLVGVEAVVAPHSGDQPEVGVLGFIRPQVGELPVVLRDAAVRELDPVLPVPPLDTSAVVVLSFTGQVVEVDLDRAFFRRVEVPGVDFTLLAQAHFRALHRRCAEQAQTGLGVHQDRIPRRQLRVGLFGRRSLGIRAFDGLR